MDKSFKFPADFVFGSATSAYQVEGNIENNDWSKTFPAGKACDHYNRYQEDFDIIKNLNQNAYRFSIEWSRIEPREGEFDKKSIEHYRKMLKALQKRKITPFLTLWHWTIPLWLAEKGGWGSRQSIFYFERYVGVVSRELGDLVKYWVTINEPTVPLFRGYLHFGYVKGLWPPKRKNIFSAWLAYINFVIAHKKSYSIIKKADKNAKIGIALNCVYVEPHDKNSFINKISVFVYHYLYNRLFFSLTKKYHDYLGINYYFHDKLKSNFLIANENKLVSDMGWEIYPEGIYHVLKEMKKYQKPIYITENGLADSKDSLRKNFIKNHLSWISKAIEEGVNIKGYFHWSLMDNFEWGDFSQRFGLVRINYKTLERKIRPSANYYSAICKNKQLNSILNEKDN